jgi:hypothetical protein
MSIPFTPLRIVSLAYQHSDSDECRISDESQFNTLVDRIVYHAEYHIVAVLVSTADCRRS